MDAITAAPEITTALTGISSLITSALTFTALPVLGCFILSIMAKWNILEKAGERGWTVLVPFYGRFCFYDITWDNGWYSLASYIPGVSYAFDVITKVKLSNRFEKNVFFTLGLVLLEPIFLAILGYDESEYA